MGFPRNIEYSSTHGVLCTSSSNVGFSKLAVIGVVKEEVEAVTIDNVDIVFVAVVLLFIAVSTLVFVILFLVILSSMTYFGLYIILADS